MNKALTATGNYDITWIMSGRARQEIMCCDKYTWYRGMTFAASNGKVEIFNTFARNNIFEFFRDIRELSLDAYDLVISDFEPVVAWAARKQGRPTLGIGHQYAFRYPVPMAGRNPLAELTMKMFAPVDEGIGMHWHHFGQPILPPIIEMHNVNLAQEQVRDKVLVYLPFENQDALVTMLREIPGWNFYIYSPHLDDFDIGNIHTRAISRVGFKNDLVRSGAIIANSGFELISECLTLGKRILTKPLHGQIEQLSNARALSELGYATVTKKLDRKIIEGWLKQHQEVYRVHYPNVASAIAAWLEQRDRVSVAQLSERLWSATTVEKIS